MNDNGQNLTDLPHSYYDYLYFAENSINFEIKIR